MFSRSYLLRRGAGHLLVIASTIVATTAHAVPGQPGTLDTTWASTSPLGAGKVMTSVGSGSAKATSVVVQPDGKIVLAGYCSNGGSFDFCALRYETNGTLDNGFGVNGKVTTSLGTSFSFANSMVIQPDGKLVLAGFCTDGSNADFCALRYQSNGSLDASFGIGGKVASPVGMGDDVANALSLQPDGKLVLVGRCANGGHDVFCALRYDGDGVLDSSFASGGKVLTAVGVNGDYATSLAIQPDGKLVLAGYCYVTGKPHFCTLRYHTNGNLDASYGVNGTVVTPIGAGDAIATGLILQPDGRLVLAGYCFNNSTSNDFCASRYNADGTIDSTFGTSGKVVTPVGLSIDVAYAALMQPDGKLLVTGSCLNGGSMDFCALRYHSNGNVDSTFGLGGIALFPLGSADDIPAAAAMQSDGKLVLAGNCTASGIDNFCAARLDGGPFGYKNCSLDIDGDNRVLATTDSLIHARIALGITGPAVVNGITFPPTAMRNTWPLIRDYLVTQCGMSLVQ